MRNVIFVVFGLILVSSSCDSGCNDCGPYTSRTYSIENFTGTEIELSFFRNSGQIEKQVIANESAEVLYQISVVSQSGFLSIEPYSYDSVQYSYNGEVVSRFDRMSDCDISINPLCEANFTLREERQDGKDNKFIEYSIHLE